MQAFEQLSQRFGAQIVVRPEEPLSGHTRFGLGGPARWMVDVRDAAVLPEVVGVLHGTGLPVITLGGGSNLIVADAGFDGVVLRFTGRSIVRDGGFTVAEAGMVWQDVVEFHNQLALTGWSG